MGETRQVLVPRGVAGHREAGFAQTPPEALARRGEEVLGVGGEREGQPHQPLRGGSDLERLLGVVGVEVCDAPAVGGVG